ncbi:hypothetical protein Ptr902_06523 [Pyrenophora tritici-repentis]|nr:hypothetical protein Ptr902_06523 [Pyrenophora tritici-repentis]
MKRNSLQINTPSFLAIIALGGRHANMGITVPWVTAQRAGRPTEPPEHQNQHLNMSLLNYVQ